MFNTIFYCCWIHFNFSLKTNIFLKFIKWMQPHWKPLAIFSKNLSLLSKSLNCLGTRQVTNWVPTVKSTWVISSSPLQPAVSHQLSVLHSAGWLWEKIMIMFLFCKNISCRIYIFFARHRQTDGRMYGFLVVCVCMKALLAMLFGRRSDAGTAMPSSSHKCCV